MRLLISYKGVMKICPNAQQYEDMTTFIKENFPNLNSSYTVNYKDCDDDLVSLSSQLDMEVMNDTATGKYIKVFVEDDFDSEEIKKINMPSNDSMIRAPQIIKKPETSEVKQTIKEQIQESIKESIKQPIELSFDEQEQAQNFQVDMKLQPRVRELENLLQEKCNKSNWWSQEEIRQWKEKNQEKFDAQISDMVEEKIQLLMPNIIQSVSEFLKNNKDSQIKCQKPFKLSKSKEGGLKDVKLTLTKKCFKLTNIFGGQMNDYQKFVSDHLMEPISDIIQKYHNENPELLKDFMGAKLVNCTKKLAFYFDGKPEQFVQIVKKNPELQFKDFIKQIKSQKQSEEKDEKMNVVSEQKSSKQEFTKLEIHQQPEIIKVNPKKQEKPTINQVKKTPKIQIKPVSPVEDKRNIDNPVKKDHVILTLKDYFGSEKTFEFLRFYQENRQYEADEIIQKYCDLQFQSA